MAQHQASPAASEAFVQLTGGTTFNSITIPPGIEPETLVVIDHITASTNNGTANGQMSIGSRSVTCYRKTITTTGGDTTDLDFAGGYPQWSASGQDFEPYRYTDRYDPNLLTTTYPIFGGVAGAGEANQAAGQSFIGTNDATVYAIMVRLQKTGNPTDAVNVDFGITSISTAPTVTSVNINAGNIPAQGAGSIWVYFPFPSTANITAGTTYFFRIRRTGARDTANYVSIAGTTSGGPGGVGVFTLDSTVWTGPSGTDDLAYRMVSGVTVTTIMPASSITTSLLVTYHYEDPAQIRV